VQAALAAAAADQPVALLAGVPRLPLTLNQHLGLQPPQLLLEELREAIRTSSLHLILIAITKGGAELPEEIGTSSLHRILLQPRRAVRTCERCAAAPLIQ
jgi:hypothetical protein